MNTTKEKREATILKLFNKVKKSGLFVKDYFKKHQTPICIEQFYRLKKRYVKLPLDS